MFSHEKLDVYRVAIEYAKWAFLISKKLTTENRHSKDHMLRASQSIPLNIAEGNGRSTEADRRHFFEISRGSAMECAAIQDLLEACGALKPDEKRQRQGAVGTNRCDVNKDGRTCIHD